MANSLSRQSLENFNSLPDRNKLEKLIYYASLAPSSHNTQPWLFKISGHSIEILADKNKKLEKSDAVNRELFLSLGAAAASLEEAAGFFGLNFKKIVSEKPDFSGPVAVFEFQNLIAPTFNAEAEKNLRDRHCNREIFDGQPLEKNFTEKLEALNTPDVRLQIIDDPVLKKKCAELAADSIEQAFTDKNFTGELSHWIKPSLKKYRSGMPGYYIGIPWLLSFAMPFMIRHLPMSKKQKEMNEPLLDTVSAFVVISVKKDAAGLWLKAGEIFERAALLAQGAGVKVGVFGGPIEIPGCSEKLQNLLRSEFRPVMFIRLGFAEKTPPKSPRHLLKELIVN